MSIYVITLVIIGWIVFSAYQVWLVMFVYQKGYEKGSLDNIKKEKTERMSNQPPPRARNNWRSWERR